MGKTDWNYIEGVAGNLATAAVRDMSDRYRSRTKTKEMKRKLKEIAQSDSGIYVGKFQTPRRVNKPSKYDTEGFKRERDVWGVQSMTDVCYLGFRSFVPHEMCYSVGVALLRYMIKRDFKCQYATVDQNILPNNTLWGSGTGMLFPQDINFHFESFNGTGDPGITSISYTVASSSTVEGFGAWFRALMLDPLYNNDQMRLRWYSYNMKDVGYAGTRQSHVTDITEMRLSAYSTCKVNIQNNTLPDNLGDTTTGAPAEAGTAAGDVYQNDMLVNLFNMNRTDANPIHGSVFKIGDTLPRINTLMQGWGTAADNAQEWMRDSVDPGTDDGVMKFGDNNRSGMKGIPQPHFWRNCTGVAPIALNPGEMKVMSVPFKFYGLLTNFFKGVRGTASGAPYTSDLMRINDLKDEFGTCVIFAFEKRMRTAVSDKIRLKFQADYLTGACIVSNKSKAIMIKAFGEVEAT